MNAMKHIARYLVRCCYCKAVFSVEGVSPYQMTPEQAAAIVRKHAETCALTARREVFRAYESADPGRRMRAAADILTTDWRVTEVRGTYNAAIKCGARCLSAKCGDCECSCGGANHGKGCAL